MIGRKLKLKRRWTKFKQRIGRLRHVLRQDYYELRAILFPFNVVRCESLPATWNDRDHVMLHACFQILDDFVRREQPWQFDADLDELQETYTACECPEEVANWLEVKRLHKWWLRRRDEYADCEEDNEKLLRLVALRRYLWT